MAYGTQFIETEIILAAQQGDTEYLTSLIAGLLPNERDALRAACEATIRTIDINPT